MSEDFAFKRIGFRNPDFDWMYRNPYQSLFEFAAYDLGFLFAEHAQETLALPEDFPESVRAAFSLGFSHALTAIRQNEGRS